MEEEGGEFPERSRRSWLSQRLRGLPVQGSSLDSVQKASQQLQGPEQKEELVRSLFKMGIFYFIKWTVTLRFPTGRFGC